MARPETTLRPSPLRTTSALAPLVGLSTGGVLLLDGWLRVLSVALLLAAVGSGVLALTLSVTIRQNGLVVRTLRREHHIPTADRTTQVEVQNIIGRERLLECRDTSGARVAIPLALLAPADRETLLRWASAR